MPGSFLAGHYSTNGAINSSIQANLRLDSQRRSLTRTVRLYGFRPCCATRAGVLHTSAAGGRGT